MTAPDIRLRAMEPEDLDMLYTVENDVKTWDIGTTNVPYSRYTLHDYIANASGDIYTDRQVRLIIENADGEAVGMVDIVDFDPRHQRAEVGIVIAAAHRRRGYATAALAAIGDYSLRVVHLHQLYAYADSHNEASLRLFQSMGYEVEARLKDWLYDGRDYHDAVLLRRFL